MAARAPSRSASTVSSTTQQHQQQLQQQQQQQQPPLRRTLFSGSLTRRPAASNTSTTSPSASTEALTPHPQGAPAASVSGFTPTAGVLHRGSTFAFGTSDNTGRDGVVGEAEDAGIIVVERGSDAFSKKAASEKDLLVRFVEEAAAEAAAATAAGSEEGDGGENNALDESARLIEIYRGHARQRVDLNEVKPAVLESLRRKVASLDDDKWMYEAESDPEES